MRRASRLLNIHRVTTARKLAFLADEARRSQQALLDSYRQPGCQVVHVQFDDMESFEHTKYKPLSITLVVTKQRVILGSVVSQMAAKGLLSSISIKKYGYRPDRRRKGFRLLFTRLEKVIHQAALFESDQNPTYPKTLKEIFPNSRHLTTKGQRGCIVGQGELKKIAWDPLFSLNHTAAMFRANINRLFRQTWCTTKKPTALQDHIDLYTDYHNRTLLG